ncbi:MAG: glycosyltransferase family 39 protein, partial [Anaerolineae bacterium]|nr:glycosyltransferase family 39 protein [Anaerolineae bacterium]
MKRRQRFLFLVPMLLLAFGLRVWGLAEHNIWWDEGIGVWVARLPVLEGIQWTATDSHPPLHYLILHLWRLIAGEGETILRFPSVVAGLFTVLFAYHLGRQLGGERTGMLTGLFVAVSRFSIMWSQET